MRLNQIAGLLVAFSALGMFAAAGTAHADEHQAKVSFSLESEHYRIEYVHDNEDTLEAQDQAMYHAAKFLLRQGDVSFKVEDVFTYSPDWQAYDIRYSAHMDCGTFACAKRLPAEQVSDLNMTADDGQIVVVIDLVGGADMKATEGVELNVGPIINAQRQANARLIMADASTLNVSP